MTLNFLNLLIVRNLFFFQGLSYFVQFSCLNAACTAHSQRIANGHKKEAGRKDEDVRIKTGAETNRCAQGGNQRRMSRRHAARAPDKKFKQFTNAMNFTGEQFYTGFDDLRTQPAENTSQQDW